MCDTKKCIKCDRELSLDQFYESYLKKGYYCCIRCKKSIDKEWYLNNTGVAKERVSKWQKNYPEKAAARNARWRKNHPEYALAWARNNPVKRQNIVNRYRNKSRAANPNLRIIHSIQSGVRSALKNNVKSGHTAELLGCSVEYLRQYLENQFTEGMSWDNYGRYGWHIDHIIPLSYFDMSDPGQQRRAWHYTNLRPLWAADNLRKSNKIEEHQLILF